MKPGEQRTLLDMIRWISAFMVAGGHMWAAFAAHDTGLVSGALWALADTRHSWVIIFFGLSGYLVGGGVLVRGDRTDWRRYALARVSRIYVVLAPALILTAMLDGLAFLIAPHNPIHAGVWRGGLFGPTPPFDRYGWREIIASLLSLEAVVGPPIGSDGPLWSLGFEWMFYLCFPPLMWLADRVGPGRRWAALGALALGSAGLLALLHMPYLGLLWLIWLAGALAQAVAAGGRWPGPLRWAGAVVCLLGFGLGMKIDYHFADAVIGFGFAVFLCRWPSGERGLNPKLDHAFAAASYSLYVTHLPVIAFVGMVFVQIGWLGSHGAASGPHLMIMLATALLASGAAALMVHRLFERRTEQVRRWLAAALIPAPARAARTALVEP